MQNIGNFFSKFISINIKLYYYISLLCHFMWLKVYVEFFFIKYLNRPFLNAQWKNERTIKKVYKIYTNICTRKPQLPVLFCMNPLEAVIWNLSFWILIGWNWYRFEPVQQHCVIKSYKLVYKGYIWQLVYLE